MLPPGYPTRFRLLRSAPRPRRSGGYPGGTILFAATFWEDSEAQRWKAATAHRKVTGATMNLQAEVRHKSEDIANDVLLDVVKAIRRRVRAVNREYDVPYIAGYSVDGRTVFIDRHLPRTFQWVLKTVRVEPFLLTHEIVEKALLDELRLHYLHAHQIAVRAERDAVKAAGVPWWVYQGFMKRHEKPIEEEKLLKVPASLDLTPYRDEKDFVLLRRLVRKEGEK
jgi:hypothetical protein